MPRKKFNAEFHKDFPHYVDIVPPIDGYDGLIEDAIFDFLEERIGSFDLSRGIHGGLLFVRYCFAKESDATLFREKFATAGEIINFSKAANG